MLMEEINRIKIKNSVLNGIHPLKSRYVAPDVVGFDAETIEGRLYSIQLWDPKKAEFILIKDESERDRMFYFINRATTKRITQFFAHNLSHDLGVVFPRICGGRTDITLCDKCWTEASPEADDYHKYECGGYDPVHITVLYPSPSFMRVNYKKKDFCFMDSYYWYSTKLKYTGPPPPDERDPAEIKKYLNAQPVGKMEPPEYLGKRGPKASEMDYFKKYSMLDAEACWYLGELVKHQLKLWDIGAGFIVRPSTLSKKIFKKKFLKNPIPYPPKWVSDMALLSYNGGRCEAVGAARFSKDTREGLGVKLYDYNSFYPTAMRIIPVMKDNQWEYVTDYEGAEGFYEISGHIPEDMLISPLPIKKQRLIFPVGDFHKATVTGYELEQILKHGRDIKIHKGAVFRGERQDSLKDYIDYFYAQKKNAKSAVDKNTQKLYLNALYGSFIQRKTANPFNGMTFDMDKPKGKRLIQKNMELIAGGLFNPAIASFITGWCRAKLFEDMEKYQEHILYCDTDSLMVSDDISLKTGRELGELKQERGDEAIIVREKLYLLNEGGEPVKMAHHGFQGSLQQLKQIIDTGNNEYTVRKMLQLRQAKIMKKQAFKMTDMVKHIKLQSSLKRKPTGITDFRQDGIKTEPVTLEELWKEETQKQWQRSQASINRRREEAFTKWRQSDLADNTLEKEEQRRIWEMEELE